MNGFVSILKKRYIKNLPNKKRRALELLKKLIEEKLNKKSFLDHNDKPRLTRLHEILNLNNEAEDSSVDYYQLAVDWIDFVQPILNEERKKAKRRLVHLGKMFNVLKKMNTKELQLENIENAIKLTSPLDKRIAACIIGIPGDI